MLGNRLVLETLEPLTGDRKCFRMINGVLVERTVKDVVPALQTNSEGLKKVLEELMKSYRSKNVEMENWKVSGVLQSEYGMLIWIVEEEQYSSCFSVMAKAKSRHGNKKKVLKVRSSQVNIKSH
jgi:predicted phage tail protein